MNPSPTLILTPIRSALPASGGTFEVLVRVQAPAQPAGTAASARPRLRLALVVDRSGSMSGDPLHQALRCVDHIVGRLHADDQVSVVLYDHHVQVPVALQSAGNRSSIQAALRGVESGGNTALFDGWLAGAKQLEGGQAGAVSRVLLLSDGQANTGPQTLADIAPQCAQWLAQGVTTTTVGLGHGFNEDLMIVSLLEALLLRQLRAKAVPAADVIVETLNATASTPEGWHSLSDLAWGSEAWLLLRLHLPAQAATGGVPRAVLSVNVQALTKDGDALDVSSPILSLPVVSAEAFAALPQDELVAKRLLEVQFAQAAMQARAALLDGDVDLAKRTLAAFEPLVAQHAWLKQSLEQMRALVMSDAAMAAKEMRFKSARMENHLYTIAESVYAGDETNAVNIPAFLRRKAQEGKGRKQ